MEQRSLVVLFTDLVGSTSQRVALGDDVADDLRRDHDRIVRGAAERHGGTWVKSTGDGALVTFSSAAGALEAGAEIQREVTSRAEEHAFEVRVGATVGEVAVEDDGDVFGMPVNTAARLCDAAVPGQLLVSIEVIAMAGSRCHLDTTPVGLLDLKGLGAPVDAHAVVWSPDAPTNLKETVKRANDGAVSGSIPESLTSFVGRQAELAELRELVKQHRLITLLGPGGMGKTRLSIALATDLRDQFPDGVWFIDLSVVTDERAVSTQVLKTLGLADTDEGSRDQLVRYLAERRVLLVIDNCEHLIATAAEVVHGIVGAAPGVRVVATSRERLGVPGEHVWEIPAIGTADDSDDGIRLFIQRAESAGARLSPSDRDDVVALCRLLDGMPLAIELASARCRSIAPGRVLERLRARPDQALGSSRTGPDRQRSLDGLVAWSVDLLDEREKALFTRLAIFDGPFPLEAAEQVCTDDLVDEFDVVDLLSTLVDKSLVATTGSHDGGLWYRLLFTIRAHANELLGADRVDLDARLLGWLTGHLRDLEVRLRSPDQTAAHREFTDLHPLISGALLARTDGLEDSRRDVADAASQWLCFAGHHRQTLALVDPLVADGDPAVRARLLAWQANHARALGRPDALHRDQAQSLVDAHDVDEATRLRVATARTAFRVDASEADLQAARLTARLDLEVDCHLRLLEALWFSAAAGLGERWETALGEADVAATRLGDPRAKSQVAKFKVVASVFEIARRPEAIALAEAAVDAARLCPVEALVVEAKAFVAMLRTRMPDRASHERALAEAREATAEAVRLDLHHCVVEASGALAAALARLGRFDEAIAVIEAHPTGGIDLRWQMPIVYHLAGRHEEAVAWTRRWLGTADVVGDFVLLRVAPFVIWSLGSVADALSLARCASITQVVALNDAELAELDEIVQQARTQLAPDEWQAHVARGDAMTLAEGAALTRRLVLSESTPA